MRVIDGLSLLVIEDDRSVQNVLERLLGREWSVQCVASGREAIASLRQRHVEAVLCDLTLPDQNGLAVAEEIVRWEPAYAGRFVFMSGTMLTEAERARVAALNGRHELKPLDFDAVQEALRTAARQPQPSPSVRSTLSLRGPDSRPPAKVA